MEGDHPDVPQQDGPGGTAQSELQAVVVLCMCVCVCMCVHLCVGAVRACVYMCCACMYLCLYIGVVLVQVVCVTPCMFGGVPSPLLPHLCVQEVQGFQSTAQVEQLLLEHGKRVVDRLGTEIDRVEIKIKVRGGGSFRQPHPLCLHMPVLSLQKHSPDVRHVDLEII